MGPLKLSFPTYPLLVVTKEEEERTRTETQSKTNELFSLK